MQKKQSLAAETAVAMHLAIEARDGRARVVVDQQLVGQRAQVNAQRGVSRMAATMPGTSGRPPTIRSC